MAKWGGVSMQTITDIVNGIEFVAHYSEIGSGYGGYSEDHKFFGRHQTL